MLAELGDGAMGRVYSAWDPKVSRVVAVKTVKSELLTSATADDYLKRFRREAVAAGVPPTRRWCVFDIGDDFLVMELVEGRTLFAMMREAGGSSPRRRCGCSGRWRRAPTTRTAPGSCTATSSPPT